MNSRKHLLNHLPPAFRRLFSLQKPEVQVGCSLISEQGDQRFWSLAVKLTLSMTTLVIVTVGGITLLSIRREQETFYAELQQQADLLLDSLEIVVRDPLYRLDADFVSDLMTALGNREQLLVSGHVYNAQGQLIADASTDAQIYSMTASAWGQQLVGSDNTVFQWQSHQLVAGRAVVVERQRLGAVSVGLSTAPLQQKIEGVRNWGLGVAAVAWGMGAVLALFISRSITTPLQELVRATRRIAQGDLGQRIQIHTQDELAVLASAFNDMGAQLQRTLTEHEQTEAALRESEERYALAVRGANDGLWDWNLLTNDTYFSPRWRAMIGLEESEVRNSPHVWFDRVHPEDRDRLQSAITAHLDGHTAHFEHEHRVMHQTGSYRWMLSRGLAVRNDQGIPYRMAGSQTDITERKQAEAQLLHGAFHDLLTGLPNRALLMERLERVIQRKKRYPDRLFAVLFLDFDRFKVINDSLGHTIGDQLLISIAQRLKTRLRQIDTVARLGGDEFVILLEEITDLYDVLNRVDQLQQQLMQPFHLSGHEVVTTASIGVVLGEAEYHQPEEILRDADLTMYYAKANGKAQYAVFDPAMHTKAVTRLQSETDLRQALERQNLCLYYQPILNLTTHQLIGFEALIRWQHPTRGWVSPAELISLAEETGLILPLGQWVLQEACRQMQAWQVQFSSRSLTINVNISSNQITQPDLTEQIEQALRQTGLAADRLKLEITESVIMKNIEIACAKLKTLRSLGVQVSIDDFGTGYSSLSYLQKLPIDTLKIDRSFISKIVTDQSSQQIVQAVITLAHSLGMEAVAEGIETADQLTLLKSLGCKYGQGYFISKPVDASTATKLIAATQQMPFSIC